MLRETTWRAAVSFSAWFGAMDQTLAPGLRAGRHGPLLRSFQGSHVDDKPVADVADDVEMSMERHNSLQSKRILT